MDKNKLKDQNGFSRWLGVKKLTVEEFALRAGVSYNTAQKWKILDRKPRRFARETLRIKFPDCPIFK